MTESEEWVRRRLHHLADTELPVGGSATADRVVDRYRRRHRARAAWLATAAAIVLAVSIPAALAATRAASPHTGGAVAASGSHPTPAPEPSASTPPRPSADPGPMATRSGPASAQVGVAYPFDLYAQCGIRAVHFAGRDWTARPPASAPGPLPDSSGITRYTGYVTGTMRLVRPDLLRFTLSDPYAAGSGQSFDFVPARGPLPVCA